MPGKYRGRSIAAVPGQQTRPTTDRVREAWASSINSLAEKGFAGAHVLDGFAGSGALGIEAVSRGADAVLFVDRQAQARKTIKANLTGLDLVIKTQMLPADTALIRPQLFVLGADLFTVETDLLARFAPYDLVFLDPPYAFAATAIAALLARLQAAELLAADCLISYEHGSQAGSADSTTWPQGVSVLSCKRYGTTVIDYLRNTEEG